ncbi:MAG: nickel/cobalt transporter (NiCoT) family protein [Solirubrobacteraceae bacterium]|nr:nickel/cobalt transporter (NiCoT) family protein [Solirubrobacteraceae bacterium]
MSRRTRLQAALTPAEWRRAGVLAAVIAGLHLLGFALLVGGGALGLGVGITAYTLGLRHAFDADHLAAIDNTTRKLMAGGQRPLSVGFWFSLGHSTVVFVVAALLAAGVRVLGGGAGAVVGPLVSGTFLLAIGALNLVLLVELVRTRDAAAVPGGLLTRVYARATRAVDRPWQMYPLGILFGLGFDTATEIALLVTAGTAAAGGLPLYAILCLPILFAAGMSLLDTLDGAFMNFAYGWAFAEPARKLFYNVVVTGLSVAVALVVGGIELISVLGGGDVDLNLVGYVVVGLFVLTWAVALSVWRFAHLGEKAR